MTYRFIQYTGDWQEVIAFLDKEDYEVPLLGTPHVVTEGEDLIVTVLSGTRVRCKPGQYLAVSDYDLDGMQRDGAVARAFSVHSEVPE